MRRFVLSLGLVFTVMFTSLAQAADRVRVEEFLEVTGFDVALESIRLTAASAPEMLGFDAEAFGSEWTRLVGDVFDTDLMHDMAIEILSQTLEPRLLEHGVAFYASDLGQRIVAAENVAHMTEDEALKEESGAAILTALEAAESPRVDYLRRMNAATDTGGTAVRALQEIQIRFLLAAAASGVIELQLDEPDLRAMIEADSEDLRQRIVVSSLISAAYTYQAFSDAEVLQYAEALEHPDMRRVYDLMNAVQYEIMANRFEALALAMTRLRPSEEL